MAFRQSLNRLGITNGVTDICMLDNATPPPFNFEDNLGLPPPKAQVQIYAPIDPTYWQGGLNLS